jgi:uncharacterized pyridoxal phosphate-containing UPF0001 family protein
VLDVVDAGLHDLGENRADELLARARDPRVRDRAITWHMIGQCQTNNVKALVPVVALWQSVDRVSLVDELARRAPGAHCLVQVDLSGRTGRGGCRPDALGRLVEHARTAGLAVQGIMAIASPDTDPRPEFDEARALADRYDLRERSFGMSGDFEQAVEHGSTMVRIGSALFDADAPDPGTSGLRTSPGEPG